MKIASVFGLTFFVSLLLVFGQRSDEENAVVQTERELAVACLKRDAGAIARGDMEDYTLTNSSSKITTRSDDIEEARKQDPKYEVFENTGMKMRVHGNTAVVTGRTHTKGISGGKPFDSEFQFTDTFVKASGRWRLLARDVSRLR